MQKELFGYTNDGTPVYKYEIKNEYISLTLTDFGARVVDLYAFNVPVSLGFDGVDGYINDIYNVGASIGRVANRIKDARLTIDGVEYALTKNNGGNCLHGGVGIQRRVWSVTSYKEDEITFYHKSNDGEDGFPGALPIYVSYKLTKSSVLINFNAVPTKKTAISLTNHAYFNLDGFENDVSDHLIKIYADRYTELDSTLIPTGKRPRVDGTAYDLREWRRMNDAVDMGLISNYDNNFFLKPERKKSFSDKELNLAAEVKGKKVKLSVYTDQSCVQLYTPLRIGNPEPFRGGVERVDFGAFAIEAQIEPNSVNLGVGIYSAGEAYTHTTAYEFEEIK